MNESNYLDQSYQALDQSEQIDFNGNIINAKIENKIDH